MQELSASLMQIEGTVEAIGKSFSRLADQHLELLKVETKNQVRDITGIALLVMITGSLFLSTFICLSLGAAYLVTAYAGVSMGLGLCMVAGAFGAAGICVGWIAYGMTKKLSLVPKQTVTTLQDTVRSILN